ncbi:MAG: hypothetical protein ABI551_09740 [Polyangiaceae bacterium]
MTTVRGLERASIAGAIVVLGVAFPLVACTDGTTPDCSTPDAGCGPDLTGGDGEDARTPVEASSNDAETLADTSTPSGDGGASIDADASHD